MKKHLFTFLCLTAAAGLAQQSPQMFRYQGRLLDGTNLVSGVLPISFRLYNTPAGGTLFYEDFNSSVTVVDGLYAAYIGDDTVFGSLTNALTNAAVYLELTVNGETLAPRERLVSVPYALNSDGSGSLSGKADVDGGNITDAGGFRQAIGLGYIDNPDSRLVFTTPFDPSSPAWTNTLGPNPRIYYGFDTSKARVPVRFRGPVEIETGIVINQAGNESGRWGVHVFDAYGKEPNNRLSMTCGLFTNEASIYYFDNTGSGQYRDLRLGCDWPGQGILIQPSNQLIRVDGRILMGAGGNLIARYTNTYWLYVSGGTKAEGTWEKDGAAVYLTGGGSSGKGAMDLYYGNGYSTGSTASIKFYHVSNSNRLESASLSGAGLFTAAGGFKAGSTAGLTTNVVIGGTTLIFTGGILTGVVQ